MARQTKDSVLLFKTETTKGVDAAPTGTDNALLVSNIDITPLETNYVDRDLIRSYYGASDQLVGTANVRISFDLEYSAPFVSGATNKWDVPLRCCMMARTVGATPTRLEYNPISSVGSTATIYYYDDGIVHKMVGSLGNAEFRLGIRERPVINFTFWGLDAGTVTDVTPTPVFTSFRTPKVVTDQNSGGIIVGGTYALGVITGGVEYPGLGFQSINLGNSVQYMPELGGDEIDVTDRAVTGSVIFNLTPTQEVNFMSRVRTNQLQSWSWLHNDDKLGVFMPAVQILNPSKIDRNGRRYIGFDFRALPVTGNDEILFFAL